ncbi:hypothetical protein TNIN_46301 [Trichonephila inaurata madagascariensis]|uniref:Uncharacterized protein n=1 Tax=Trichonephila inaurata madagascariensis TaxID=2747483 RepID=A0A8X7CAP4_9ARAC|nr:hypothetical protein TNIN_46301 [Trichonephila inaurata madagascariensis]
MSKVQLDRALYDTLRYLVTREEGTSWTNFSMDAEAALLFDRYIFDLIRDRHGNEEGIVVGRQSFDYADQMDNQRMSRQNRRSSLESKEGRKALLQAQNEEGLLYGAGIAD